MTEISKTSSGLKGLVCPDTESTEVDIHQEGVTMVKSLCYFCHANCGVLAYVTCSPHLAETSSVVAEARRVLGDAIEPLDTAEAIRRVSASEIDIVENSADGHVQLWPHRHGTDAMFISLFRRVDAAAAP